MITGGLYGRLLEAMRQKELEQHARSGMAPDLAEITRRYPQGGVSAGPHAEEAEPSNLSPSGGPTRDPNFRQLSMAPFVERLQRAEYPDVSAGATAPSGESAAFHPGVTWPLSRGSNDPSFAGVPVPWPATPRMTPVPVGFRGLPIPRGLGPLPWPQSVPKGATPPMPEAWRHLGPLLGLMPELLREHFMSEGDDSLDQDAVVDPITELEIGTRGKGVRRRRQQKVPLSINGKKPHVPSPPIAPDALGEPLGGIIGAGGGDDFGRCKRAASGSDDTWNEFCNSLATPALRARCRSNTPKSRIGWCGQLDES